MIMDGALFALFRARDKSLFLKIIIMNELTRNLAESTASAAASDRDNSLRSRSSSKRRSNGGGSDLGQDQMATEL